MEEVFRIFGSANEKSVDIGAKDSEFGVPRQTRAGKALLTF